MNKPDPNAPFNKDHLRSRAARIIKEEGNTVHYYDKHGYLRKYTKTDDEYSSRRIRLKFMERPVRYWRSISQDQRLNITALLLCPVVAYVVFNFSMYLNDREARVSLHIASK